MSRWFVGCGVMAALLVCVSVVSAADEAPAKKKGKGNAGQNRTVAQLTQKLSVVALTEEQKSKIQELGKELQGQLKTLREEGYSPELMQRRIAATKEARDAGTKQKDIAEAVKSKFSEEENATLAKAVEANAKFRQRVFAILTDEQKEKLPPMLRRQMEGPQPGQGKKKAKENA